MWNVETTEQGNVLISCTAEGGGFEILCLERQNMCLFEIFEIPQYGGEPVFDCIFETLKEALAHSMTYS